MAKIATNTLEKMCQRAATGLNAGLDVRTLWRREAERGPTSHQLRMQSVVQKLDRGETLADALGELNGYLPQLTVEMVNVGEKSGRLGDVFEHLAQHYANIRQLWRSFLSMIWWPMFELVGSIFVIALLIMVLGFIGSATGTEPIDLFGLGLSWQGNLMLFLGGVTFVLGGIAFGLWALIRGWFGPAPLSVAMRIPVLGTSLRLLSISRFAWSFGMAIDAGMDALACMSLGLSSTQNAFFKSHEPAVLADLERGKEFHEALRATQAFPEDFLDTMEAAELSGTVTESLDRLSKDYQERASAMFRALAVIGGILVMIMVGAVIVACAIALIMKLYIGPLYDAMEGNF